MADSSVPTSMDFCSFVRELNQTPQIDYASSSRNCCPAESRLSQEFENQMQQLLSNYDLDNENDVEMGIPMLKSVHCEPDQVARDQSANDSAFSVDSHDESLETTLDNEDDPLELTGEDECDDSGDAGDGGSSDEQQQSRSLSLSYSLSISHAQENFSQYSQSTDKGLSKRYDSPCSYEDDRESECTNFDKLDDWNDFINDMHNNNNNGDSANRDFREYYDEYLASKNLKGNDEEDEPTEECNAKEEAETSRKTVVIERDNSLDSVEEGWDNRSDTPAVPEHTSAMDKCRSFLEYRNPSTEVGDDPMDAEGNSSSTTAEPIERVPSCKRKFRYDDFEDVEYEVAKVITEKFHKTDVVPFHGCHDPISLIDDELFAQMVRIESPRKTPVPVDVKEHINNNESECSETDDGEKDENESTTATTPTNARNLEQMFQTFEEDANGRSVVENQRLLNKIPPRKRAIEPRFSAYYHFNPSNLTRPVNTDTD